MFHFHKYKNLNVTFENIGIDILKITNYRYNRAILVMTILLIIIKCNNKFR